MLNAIRVTLSAYTASFRVPSFVGHQRTLTVPPLCTVFGLLSAAAGRWILPNEVEWLAYRCEYESKAMDLEAIYQFDRASERAIPLPKPHPKTRTVLNREFLTMPSLTLYLTPDWEMPFRRPRYALLLGRTQDVAMVESIARVTLKVHSEGEVEVSGVLLPVELIMQNNAPALLQNLPVAFTNEPHRQPLRMHVFGIVDAHRPAKIRDAPKWLIRDEETNTTAPLYRREWILRGENALSTQ